jgi:arsenite-transporting ATPase
MVGLDRLRILGGELFGDHDPIASYDARPPFVITEEGSDVIMTLTVGYADEGELDVIRHGDELYVTVGPYRRAFILPDSLKRRIVSGAKLSGVELKVRFSLEETNG